MTPSAAVRIFQSPTCSDATAFRVWCGRYATPKYRSPSFTHRVLLFNKHLEQFSSSMTNGSRLAFSLIFKSFIEDYLIEQTDNYW
jgi:hypothetical protein